MGQGPVELLLGLGTAKKIDRLSIRWPSGLEQVLSDLAVDRTIRIVEGEAEASHAPLALGHEATGAGTGAPPPAESR
jgi:hypothetical protein